MKKKILILFLLSFHFFAAQTAVNDNYTTETNSPINISAPGLLSNDTDPDNNPLSIVSFLIGTVTYTPGQTATLTQGSITINADGSFIFTPAAGYNGNVPTINYTISNGTSTSSADLNITVENTADLLKITRLVSCNQGYTFNDNGDGVYKVKYSLQITNTSTATGYDEKSLIRGIALTNNLNAIYGNGCAFIDESDINIETTASTDSNDLPYPRNFTNSNNPINPDFLNDTATSDQVFIANHGFILYPRQNIIIDFCVTIDPLCNGRTGSSIDFDTEFEVASPTKGNDDDNLLLTDFHTTEAIITAGLHVSNQTPSANPDGTFSDKFTIIITNEGTGIANNVNFNMGLGNFFDNGVEFDQLTVSQVSGPSVSVNTTYNGDTDTQLLTTTAPGNSLNTGESITLEINYLTKPFSSTANNIFTQLDYSQTQGDADGGESDDTNNFDESTPENRKIYSFVTWSDNLSNGRPNHLDRYYPLNSAIKVDASILQCDCNSSSVQFFFTTDSTIEKEITATEEAPGGILEHEQITFQITVTNTSEIVQLDNLKLIDSLNAVCGIDKIVSISKPIIKNSTAETTPTINENFNGTTEPNIFTSDPSLLKKDETVTIEFTVVFNENCIGVNTANFTATDPINREVIPNIPGTAPVDLSTDTDNDGITNNIDLDDDDDTIPDIEEYNGLNPLDDDDNDLTPNYRDLDYGADTNGDGIVDLFDFDNDGVPNHFDLDSDNDGVFDIVEVGNLTLDTNKNGQTNSIVGINGLDDTVEDIDALTAVITYTIPNTDEDSTNNPNFLDLDSDGDGIVDNIEAQTTLTYRAPNLVINASGIDTAYFLLNAITPTDTDGDLIFDYLDTNSDDDAYLDDIEGWDIDYDRVPNTVPSNTDADNDGLDDAYDIDITNRNPTNGQTPLSFPNLDRPSTPERDWRETRGIFVLIENAVVDEGGVLIFNISLVNNSNKTMLIESDEPIIIDFSTVDGTDTTTLYDVATAPFDYTSITNQTITFLPGENTQQLTISSLDDTIYEQDELFTLNGTITSKATINLQVSAVGTIIDNDEKPTITMNDSKENEGVDLIHTITLSHPSSTPVVIDIATSDDLAISPNDYLEVSSILTIDGTIDATNANTEISFKIPTVIDNLKETDEETLNVVGVVTSGNVGLEDLTKTGTIVDIDPYPSIVISDYTVTEGESLLFTITLLNASLEPMQTDAPFNFSLETIDETATGVLDFEKTYLPNFSIPAFTSTTTQTIQTIDDELNELTETMLLQAIVVTPAATLTSFGTGTIKDNDFPNLFSPNGDGKSDLFRIDGFERFLNFKLTIFDRWGSIIYNYNNNGNPNPIWWDGTHNGKPVIEGVYYFTLNYNNDITPPKTNFIQLIR